MLLGEHYSNSLSAEQHKIARRFPAQGTQSLNALTAPKMLHQTVPPRMFRRVPAVCV